MKKDSPCNRCMFSRYNKTTFFNLFKKRHCSFHAKKQSASECDFFLPLNPREYDDKTKVMAENAYYKIVKVIKDIDSKK